MFVGLLHGELCKVGLLCDCVSSPSVALTCLHNPTVPQGVSSSAKIVDPNVKCGAGIAHGIDNVLLFTQLPASLGR